MKSRLTGLNRIRMFASVLHMIRVPGLSQVPKDTRTNIGIKFNTYLLRKQSFKVKMSYIKKPGQDKLSNLEYDTIDP